MKMLAVCSLLLSALCLRAELAFKWTVEVSQPLPYAAEALQGESFNLEAKVVQYRVPMLEAAEATFYYQTPEMEASQWYTVPAAWDATTATASVAFTPAMDVGSTKYRFFFGIETAQGKNYRVFGTLRLKASPGFSPATLEPTDVRAEIIQEILEAVFEEADDHYATKEEHAALAVQVQGKAPASHTHSDLQQSATVLLQAINSEAETREEADAALEVALAEEVAAREEADVKLSAQVPVVRATLPNANNNANGYGYRGPLSRLGVYGEAVVIRRLAITTRLSGNQNTTVPLWARVVRNVDGVWVVCAQAKEPRKWEEVAPGSDLAWEMEAVPGVLPPSADETVAIVWVNDPDAPAAQSDGQVSWRTVSVAGGLGFALPTVPTTSSSIQSWSPRIVLDFTAVTKTLKVDTSLSSTSTNPVQNSALYYEINGKASKTEFNSDNYATPYVKAFGTSMHSLRTVFNANNEADNWAEKFDNAKLTFEWWHQYNNVKEDSFDVPMTAFRALANGGGGHTEVWKGNVGFGEQDTFFGPKAVAAEEGQFYKGYPRLHNHGQDIHEVSGFSRDSRDDETVWSHRLLLPWDLAKANDTSYLMAGVVWNGKRRILTHPNYGLETTFVQPLIPQNTGGTKDYGITHAIPCFENSPMYWNGNIIYNDSEMLDSGVPAEATKAVIVPWSRVTGVVGSPDELALKSDIPSIDSALSSTSTNPVQNKAVKAELDKKLALTGGTVTGETHFKGGIRTDSFKTLYGTPLLETVSSKGFKFTGLYQFVPYQQTKPFFTAESGTTTLDVTTAKATSFVEDGTALSAKYATKSELEAVPKITVDTALSTSSTNPVQNKIIAAQLAKRTIATASGGYLMDIATDNGTGIRFSTQDLNASGYLNLWYLNNGGMGTGMRLPTSTALDPLYDRLSAVEELVGEPVTRSSHAIAWQEGTSLLTVTPNADGAVVFDPTGWPEGQSLLVRLTTPEDFGGVPASVRLVGYFDIEPASTYQLTAYVVGGTLHVVPLLREE